MRVRINGEVVELQGIRQNSVVVVRPADPMDDEAFKSWARRNSWLNDTFLRHDISIIFDNHKAEFEVLPEKRH